MAKTLQPMKKQDLRKTIYALAEPGLKQVTWSVLRLFSVSEIRWIVANLEIIEFAASEKAAKSKWSKAGKRKIRIPWTLFQFAPPKAKRAIFVMAFFDMLNESLEQNAITTRFDSFMDEIRGWIHYKHLINAGARTSELLALKG